MLEILMRIIFVFVLFTGTILPTSKEEIARRINEIISKLPPNTISGVVVYNPLMQDTIINLNGSKSMIPASITKLFTTSTSLSIMGGDHKLSTKIYSTDNNITDGIINGDIYIKGYGNSVLTSDDLNELAIDIRNKGIIKITGSIYGDDSYFDDVYTREDWIEDEGGNIKLPPVSALVLDNNRTTIRKKYRRRYRYVVEHVKDPSIFIANSFSDKIKSIGIELEGNVKKGRMPSKVIFLTENYITLRNVLKLINKNSDNFLAECLFKSIGAESSGLQGNSFFSQQAILKFIKENNIYTTGTEIVDGSGISRFDSATPLAVTGLLEKMYFDLVHFEDFYNSLSISGVDGTLRGRLIGTRAENNFRGKTGTLNGVVGVAGYLMTPDGNDLIITIMFQFTKGGWGFYRDVQDEIISLLADWEIENSD